MTIQLSKFLGLWLMMLTIFTCVAVLAFSQIEFFHDFHDVFIYFFEASCGNFNINLITYDDPKYNNMRLLGEVY